MPLAGVQPPERLRMKHSSCKRWHAVQDKLHKEPEEQPAAPQTQQEQRLSSGAGLPDDTDPLTLVRHVSPGPSWQVCRLCDAGWSLQTEQ